MDDNYIFHCCVIEVLLYESILIRAENELVIRYLN